VVTHPAPPISAVAPALPTALDAVLAKALDKDPDRRHPTMRALGAELAEALHGVAAASHAQVGSLMCSLFAVELADRRDVIRAIADPEQASTASMVHHDLPLAPTEPVIAPILVTPSSEEAPPPDVTAGDAPVRGLKRAPLLLLAVALGIIGAGLASYESDDRPRLLLDVVRVPLPFAEPVTPAPADAPSARVVIDMDAPDSAASAQPAPDTSAPEPPPIARPKPATKAGNKIPDNPYTERLR
jgi:serine/threonine-protein kinase